MWYAPKVTIVPEAEPISVADVMAQAHIDSSDESDVVARMIKTARGHVERYCNIIIATQTVENKCDSFADFCRLPIGPVKSVVSIAYVDLGGDAQTIDASVYELRNFDELDSAILLTYGQVWPTIQPGSLITVSLIAGFGDVPPPIIGAMHLFVAENFEHRESDALADWTTFDALLCNFRRGA